MDKRYYWLKLKRDFFKRHDIRIIEAMPNGKDYILFYLKLLCESVDHEGKLRFSEQIPYNAEMLAVITDTNQDTVVAAVKIFTELGMMEIMDDGTFYMTECDRMIGSAADNDHALRQARYRERQKLLALEAVTGNVTECHASVTKSDESKSKSIELERENIKEKEAELLTDFEEAWKAYPRKQGKDNAQRDYLKARKEGVSKEEILSGIERYKWQIAACKTEPQYILHGSTWFHQRRWTDEYTEGKESFERDVCNYEEVYE